MARVSPSHTWWWLLVVKCGDSRSKRSRDIYNCLTLWRTTTTTRTTQADGPYENRAKRRIAAFCLKITDPGSRAPLLVLLVEKKSPKWWDYGCQCATQFVFSGKHNANPLNVLVHLQLLCAQRGRSWCLAIRWKVAWLHNANQFKGLLHLPPFGRNLKRVISGP